MKLSTAARAVGLAETATQDEVFAEVDRLMAARRAHETARWLPPNGDVVSAALADGRIDLSQEAAFRSMARNDPEGTRKVLATTSVEPPPDTYPEHWLSPIERARLNG